MKHGTKVIFTRRVHYNEIFAIEDKENPVLVCKGDMGVVSIINSGQYERETIVMDDDATTDPYGYVYPKDSYKEYK